jgi:hypothetical protein
MEILLFDYCLWSTLVPTKYSDSEMTASVRFSDSVLYTVPSLLVEMIRYPTRFQDVRPIVLSHKNKTASTTTTTTTTTSISISISISISSKVSYLSLSQHQQHQHQHYLTKRTNTTTAPTKHNHKR